MQNMQKKTAAKQTAESPDSPGSVGWVEPKTIPIAARDDPFKLECGVALAPVELEYETYGKLSPDRNNVVLILHALSGDAHAAGWDKSSLKPGRAWRKNKPGWWDAVIGPGKPIDTNRYFVLCSNFIGSCYGSTGPSSLNPRTGKPFGLTFPMVTVHDWIRAQKRLLDLLGIKKLKAVIGGSLGGLQAIEWALAFPDLVERCMVLAAAPRLSAQGLAFNAVGRFSILNDGNFHGGNYYGRQAPAQGLAAARMLAHITYLSEDSMRKKFGRRLQDKEQLNFGFGVEYQVESYLNHQGLAFVERFDANSYLYITRAMDYYDAAAYWGEGDLTRAMERLKARLLVVSFSTDWLYPPDQCKAFAHAMVKNRKPVSYVEVPSPYGHDAFLLESQKVGALLNGFLET